MKLGRNAQFLLHVFISESAILRDETVEKVVFETSSVMHCSEIHSKHEWHRVICAEIFLCGQKVFYDYENGSLRVLDTPIWETTGDGLREHGDIVNFVSVIVSGGRSRIVCGSFEKTVRIWDISTGKAIGAIITVESCNFPRRCICWRRKNADKMK